MSFEFIEQKLTGVILIKPDIKYDSRGFFAETYKRDDFAKNGINCDFIQENYSKSQKNVLRGLHYQVKPYSQSKLIKCIRGEIIDIVVDLRPESQTFKQHLKLNLSEKNQNMLFIPKGFAHGFLALEDDTEIIYKTDEKYNKESERGIYWADKDLNIDWGINFSPILSEKDKNQPVFSMINQEELSI